MEIGGELAQICPFRRPSQSKGFAPQRRIWTSELLLPSSHPVAVRRKTTDSRFPQQDMDAIAEEIGESIQAKLNRTTSEDQFWGKSCIYRVPKLIRDANEDSYTPMVVSIGPYHHGNQRLSSMETYKLYYLKSFLSITQANADLSSYLKMISAQLFKISASYVDPTASLPVLDFAEMVLTDGVFIVELFRRYNSDPSQVKDDLIVGSSVTAGQVFRDILLAENQLPFFVLKDIYRLGLGKPPSDGPAPCSLTDIACKFFGLTRSDIRVHSASNEALCCHLLDLFRTHFQHKVSNPGISVNRTSRLPIPTAARLSEAGVKFQAAKTAASSSSLSYLLDIHFNEEGGVLTIPRLTMAEEPTQSILRNMMWFEQSGYPFNKSSYLLDYCYLLGCLIKTPRDVQVLADVGIVENYCSGCEVLCDMFSTASDDNAGRTAMWDYYYAGLSKLLVSRCDKSDRDGSKKHDMTTLEVV